MNYFDKLPTISYNGYTVKHIMARAQLSEKTKQNKLIYYPYRMKGDDRADLVSSDYYDSPGYTWLVWMTNNVIDPYYGLSLTDYDFVNYIISKYGSLEASMRKICHYKNNWEDYRDIVSSAEYVGLASNFRKYYDPVVNNDYTTIGYIRKPYDDILSTNRIVTMEISGSVGDFAVGEEVRVDIDNYAFVNFANSSAISVQHVTGSFSESDTITGQDSGATATVSSATVTYETLASSEPTYWTAVSYYEHEHDLNEKKKEIQLMDIRFKNQMDNELSRVMKSR